MVLSPAAAGVIHALGADGLVVGKTRSIRLFPHATVVGTHIRPNPELVAACRPQLIVATSEKFFSRAMAERLGARFYLYDPRTLEEVLESIKELGRILDREREAEELVKRLKDKLGRVVPPRVKPRVVYEVMQRPYMVAGKRSIVADIVERAGGIYVVDAPKKLVRTSCERVRMLRPQIYIYQVGPMNRNPSPPSERPCFRGLKMEVVRVDELKFSRAGVESFDRVLELNRLFVRWAGGKR